MRTLISILWISFFPLAAAAQGDDLSYRLKKVIKDKKAEIGIAVILDAQDTVTVNNDDRYPLMSVFKFHQALAVADYLDRNGLTPDTEIFIPEEELVPDTYSPLRDEFPEGEISLSVSRLLEYSLQLSDNNACDILFEHTGGPAATDRYVRSLGLCNFAIAATEQQMHDDPQTCYENWSTPLEAAALLELLVTEQILTPTLREMIRQNLINRCRPSSETTVGNRRRHRTQNRHERPRRTRHLRRDQRLGIRHPAGRHPLYHRRLHQRFGGKPGNKCPNHSGYLRNRLSIRSRRIPGKRHPPRQKTRR